MVEDQYGNNVATNTVTITVGDKHIQGDCRLAL
jgi:hypothetical protein